MARIESIEVCIARVELDNPVQFATRTVTAREYCLVKIRSTDGVEGIGYCYAVNKSGRLLQVAVTDLLGPMLIGQDSLRVEGLWREMYQEALLQGRAGAVIRALSALDTALWDLNARSVELPLYQYLGANLSEKVPAYASGGYYWPGKTPEKLADEVRGFAEEGYSAIKIKVGKLSPGEEVDRIHAAREAIGPDVHLMLDANNAWNDMATAMSYITRLEPYNPYWIEEPFSPDDIDNHARLAKATRITVATGEVEAGRWRFKEILEKGAAGILQTDATVCGGITEWRRIAATAASYGVTVSPHAWHDIHIHLVASAPNATYAEFMPDDHIVNFRRLIDRQLVAEKGYLLLPTLPGLGFNFSDEAVKKYGITYPGEKNYWVKVC
ncbi:MAG TPA: mandelate racemase/muconate lactonizing enzyme family protein [Eoetvoesiella sp.]